MPKVTHKEMLAVLVAWNELRSYLDVVGEEGDLDEEEMPQAVLRGAANDLRGLLHRHGMLTKDEAII